MKTAFQSYFYFTKTELRGTLFLIVISLIFLSVPYIFNRGNEPTNTSKYTKSIKKQNIGSVRDIKSGIRYTKIKSLSRFVCQQHDINKMNKNELLSIGLNKFTVNNIIKYKEFGGYFKDINSVKRIYGLTNNDLKILKSTLSFKSERVEKGTVFREFDPNKVTREELISMGMNSKLVTTLINFREKGFQFKDKSDLLKVYGMTEKEYSKLYKYVQIDLGNDPKYVKQNNYKPSNKQTEINTASFEDLVNLYGIGPSWANRIIKFRNALGGFKSLDQIKEIKGINDSLEIIFSKQLNCNGQVQKLNLASINYDDLKAHPYISNKQAYTMINYMKHHGNFKSVEEVNKCKAFTQEEMNKLSAYLEFKDVGVVNIGTK